MAEPLTVKPVYDALSQYMRNRAGHWLRARPCVTACSNRPTRLNEKPRGHPDAGLCCLSRAGSGVRLFQFTSTTCCKAKSMNDQNDANEVRPPAPTRGGQRCARADSRLGVSLLGFPAVRLGSAGVAVSVPAREQRLSFGPLVRVRVLRRSGVSDALGV